MDIVKLFDGNGVEIPNIANTTVLNLGQFMVTGNTMSQHEVGMRRFVIIRDTDITGISGTGLILYGVEWLPGGPCDVYWLGTKTTGQYPSIDVVKSTHCYNNNARVEYIDN